MPHGICKKGRGEDVDLYALEQIVPTSFLEWILEVLWPLQVHMLCVPWLWSVWSLAVVRVYTWGGCWLMKSWLQFHVWPGGGWTLRSLKLWSCNRGVGGCREKWLSVPRSFLSLSLELLIHIWQMVFSGGYKFMEMGLLLNAADSLEFAELF